ncbi:hypothetical protein [Paraburkholderia terricola]|uniref:hypothetical protein n=1 Tax=Paraburkholderia terricola TaxID=169427 RepID=UPI003ECF22BE
MKRWTPREDALIERQLASKVDLVDVRVRGRHPSDVRKRAMKLGLFVPFQGHAERRAKRWDIIERCLTAGPKSIPELSAVSGLGRCVVTNVIELNRALVHVVDYGPELPGGRAGARIFALGEGEDASAPVKGSGKRALKVPEDDPEAAMIKEAKQRLARAERRGELIRRDPYVEALFGRYKAPRRETPSQRRLA